MSEPVTLASMSVTNFRGIESAKVQFTGGTVWISGNNGEGKSSFLAAVATLFFGVEYAGAVPLREGAESGEIVGTLSNGLHARMKVTAKGVTSLAVTDKTGLKLGTPRAVLNKLIGSLAFDPLRFMTELDAKQQIEQLKTICGLDFKTLDKERADAYQRRADVNRTHKEAAAAVEQFAPFDPSAPTEPIDASQLMADLKAAQQHNAAIDAAARDIAAGETALLNAEKAADELRKQLDSALARVAAIQEALVQHRTAYQSNCAKRDTATIEQAIADSGKRNASLVSNRRRRELEATAAKWSSESEKLTQAIEAIDAEKAKRLSEAKMPIEGLAFTDEFVTYKGKPLSQASTREQMEVSFAICASLNPTLRAVIVPHGSLITPSNRPHFEAIAERYGMQPLVELADESGDVPGIVIEAGTVKRCDYQPETPAFDPTVQIALPDVSSPSAVLPQGSNLAPWAM